MRLHIEKDRQGSVQSGMDGSCRGRRGVTIGVTLFISKSKFCCLSGFSVS